MNLEGILSIKINGKVIWNDDLNTNPDLKESENEYKNNNHFKISTDNLNEKTLKKIGIPKLNVYTENMSKAKEE